MRAVIQAVDFSVPERRITNDELAAALDTSDEWIRSHTGIGARHVAGPSVVTSDLALEACRKVLDKARVPSSEIDFVIVATVTGDYIGFPSVSCIVQDKLGASRAAAMDICAGCTGFIYGLEVARSFIVSGVAKKILVVGAEIISRIVNWKDRNTCVLFGDGAGAALVTAENGDDTRGIISSILRSDGSGAQLLYRPGGGTKFPITDEAFESSASHIHMDGRQVYNFAVKVVTDGILELMEKGGVCLSDVAWIVPHQANERIIEAASKRSKIPLSKFFVNIEEYANTSAASIPIALSEMQSKGLVKQGDLLLTFGFGAGLTYGGNLIRW